MEHIVRVILWTAALFLGVILLFAVKPKTSRRIIAVTVVLTAVGGLLLYGYGYASVTPSTPLAVIRSFFAVASMFVGDEALGDISATPLFQYTLTHIVFWLLHFLGLFSSVGTVITTLGAGLLQKLRMWLLSRKKVAVIYGLGTNALQFARHLLKDNTAVVVVDPNPEGELKNTVTRVGGIFRDDADAVNASPAFLRSLRIRLQGRSVRLYALAENPIDDMDYARKFLTSLEKLNIPADRTALTIIGPEDETKEVLQNHEGTYGYGSVLRVNAPEMAARLLMQHYPIYEKMTFDKTGRATKNLHVLIVGCGSVGQAVLKQAVMNGQFLGSRFRATVFAPDIQLRTGRLLCEQETMVSNYNISFIGADGRSEELYRFLLQQGKSVDFIVVCSGPQRTNHEIAELLEAFLRHKQLHIPIYQCAKDGIYFEENGSAQFYSIYHPDVLSSDAVDTMAKEVNQTYCKTGTADENWRSCGYFSRMSSRASADFIPALLSAAGTTAEQALVHWSPPQELLENLAITEHLRWCAFHYAMGFNKMDGSMLKRRGEAFKAEMEKNGASRIKIGKDLDARLHACLVDWEQLDALSAAENRYISDKKDHRDYKQVDRDNVLSIQKVLIARKAYGEAQKRKKG